MYKERVSGYPGWICFAVIPLAILTFILVTLVLQGLRALTYSTFSWLGLEGAGVALLGATLLIFTLILFPLALLTMPALGLLWAPFAALVCSRAARARGLETRRYALAGAIYSILFFWPWVYLILRMYNKHIPGCIIRIVYILTYGVVVANQYVKSAIIGYLVSATVPFYAYICTFIEHSCVVRVTDNVDCLAQTPRPRTERRIRRCVTQSRIHNAIRIRTWLASDRHAPMAVGAVVKCHQVNLTSDPGPGPQCSKLYRSITPRLTQFHILAGRLRCAGPRLTNVGGECRSCWKWSASPTGPTTWSRVIPAV